MSRDEEQVIFSFGGGQAEGGNHVRHLVGGKGASLAEMTRAGLDVPPGFTISAACCRHYHTSGEWPAGLKERVRDAVSRLESLTGRRFGQGADPLLVAVRSGAAESMPGMMDTILNVGLNADCVRACARQAADPRAAWKDYRDFLASFAATVGGVEGKALAAAVDGFLAAAGVRSERDLSEAQWDELCRRLADVYRAHTSRDVPSDPYELLFQAVEAVFRSWQSERAVAYRKHHRIDGLLGTAVNVQAMCPSEVSGVLFTAHPVDPNLDQMVIEASYGLGEAVVLGKVTPDQFLVARGSLDILERRINAKHRPAVSEPEATRASLTDEQVRELARLGRRVEEYFQTPCDVEWGLARGKFYLLQARPIRRRQAASPEELERARREEIARLRQLAGPGVTVWSRYNLAEILPAPTPLTWSIVRQFMAGRGGFGQMYRDLGFDPDPALDEVGIFDLVCGRPYCNLSREPRMQYRLLPFEHPVELLRKDPQKAIYPTAVFNPRRARWWFWLLVPVIFVRLLVSGLRLQFVARTFPERFRKEVVPPFLADVAREEQRDLSAMDPAALVQHLHAWMQRTLFDFGRESLKPTALAAIAMSNLERTLAQLPPNLPPGQPLSREPPPAEKLEKARAEVRKLLLGARPDPETDVASALRDLARGKISRAAFLASFGHRGPQEMELSTPRWREDAEALDRFGSAAAPAADAETKPGAADDPLAAYRLTPYQRQVLEGQVENLRTLLGLRETAKHHLMRGYALLRRILLELDRRFRLEGGIFFLTLEELPDLVAGRDLGEIIRERCRQRELLLKLPVPPVLFSDDLEAIGRAPAPEGAAALQGVPLSAGVAEGTALVLTEPPASPPVEDGYILVCPSTDPAWMPLFLKASALVMESGGMLSHGAIVAREFGLPAVAGLPDVHRRVRTGQRLSVDGGTGKVVVLD